MGLVTGLQSMGRKALGIQLDGEGKAIINVLSPVVFNEYEELLVQENRAFYSGDEGIIANFYEIVLNHQSNDPREQWFWKRAPNTTIRIHTPIPATISKVMKDLLFSGGYDIGLDIANDEQDMIDTEKTDEKKEKETKREQESKEKLLRLESILKINKASTKFKKGAEQESWSGHIAFKIIFDPDFIDAPLFEVYPRDRIEIVKKHTLTQQITFFDFYTVEEREYRLRSIYGKGFVKHELEVKRKDSSNWDSVDVDTIPQTSGLKDYVFLDSESNPLDIVLAIDKPNALPNNIDQESGYGRSDYAGLAGEFNNIDETISSKALAIRKTKVRDFISDDLLPKDRLTGQRGTRNDFDNNIISLKGDIADKDKKLQTEQPKFDAEGYIKSFQQDLAVILSRLGINASTIGLETASADASGESIREREKSSLRTRDDKIELWTEMFDELLSKIMLLDDNRDSVSKGEKGNSIVFSDMTNYDISFEFKDYIVSTLEQRIKTMAEAITGKVADISKAVDEVWQDGMTDDDKADMVASIMKENNIGTEFNLETEGQDVIDGVSTEELISSMGSNPTPNEGESRSEFNERCVPELKTKEKRTQKQSVFLCNLKFDEAE